MCVFRYLWYHSASAGSFSSLEQEFVCAGIFSFFSRRLILEKIPIGEWYGGWGLERRPKICRTAKGCLSGPGSPPENPTRVKSTLFPRIGLVRDSLVSISLGPSQYRIESVQWARSLSRSHSERSKRRNDLSSQSKTPSRRGEHSLCYNCSNLLPVNSGTDLRWSLFIGSGSSVESKA